MAYLRRENVPKRKCSLFSSETHNFWPSIWACGRFQADQGRYRTYVLTQPMQRQLKILGGLAVDQTKAKRTVKSQPGQSAQLVQNGLLDMLVSVSKGNFL